MACNRVRLSTSLFLALALAPACGDDPGEDIGTDDSTNGTGPDDSGDSADGVDDSADETDAGESGEGGTETGEDASDSDTSDSGDTGGSGTDDGGNADTGTGDTDPCATYTIVGPCNGDPDCSWYGNASMGECVWDPNGCSEAANSGQCDALTGCVWESGDCYSE